MQRRDIGMILLAFFAVLICVSIMIISLVIFLIWFYKAYSNLYRQKPLKYKKKWAILGWLIPVINLYLPYLMIKEMYLNIAVLTNNPLAHESVKKLTTVNILWALYILLWILDIVYYAVIYPDASVILILLCML
jgi:heme/copper-type cytochrome/quinol oxidase subunit 2